MSDDQHENDLPDAAKRALAEAEAKLALLKKKIH